MTRTALWLLGHGVAASPSPAMQNAGLRACGLDWEYAIRDVAPDDLPRALDELRSGAAAGCNVTIPHKRAVAAACDELRGDALLTGAVNTVIVRDGMLIGENTDALGLQKSLSADGLWPDRGSSVVVLGAGGAAVAASLALSRSNPAIIHTAARRRDAGASLPWQAPAITDALHAAPTSMLVNATPAGLADLPVDIAALPRTCTVVDLRYRPRPVDLVAAARARGLRATDGLGMLLHQGMLSFQLWTGLEPPWDVARDALAAAVDAA
jgi:shikimate dehydrogenase